MNENQTIEFAALPALGEDLAGGRFAGIITTVSGFHCAVVLLPAHAENLTWERAKAWAAEQGGELPTRPVAALLYALSKPALQPHGHWHWTSDEYEFDASFAWYCTFYYGIQSNTRKSFEGSAVAVRLIPVDSKEQA